MHNKNICLCILAISFLAFVQISLSLRTRIIAQLRILYRLAGSLDRYLRNYSRRTILRPASYL